jgi:hypothetical protein
MRRFSFLIIALLLFLSFSIYAQEYYWYKGNTHCHTTNSDGDELPRRVVRWYRDHGYNFLVITDHDYITEIKYLDTDKNDDFILIPGEEVTDRFKDARVHVNAINITECIKPQRGNSIVETLQNNVDAIVNAGGIAQINHPNWKWSFTDKEMSQVKNARLLEVYNYCLESNNFGAGGAPGMEEIWDRLLSGGFLLYGVASDDAHNYIGEFSPLKANPGTGWIMVKAKELTLEAIVQALEQGEFYLTIGVCLKGVIITEKEYIVEIEQDSDKKYTTSFIGKDGTILEEVYGTRAVYTFKGDELYVRARIFATSGEFACTQPFFLKAK